MNRIWWGQGKLEGSFVPVFNFDNRDYQLFAVRSKGHVEIYFHTYQTKPPFDAEEKRKELLTKINRILVEPIPYEAITKYPKIPL